MKSSREAGISQVLGGYSRHLGAEVGAHSAPADVDFTSARRHIGTSARRHVGASARRHVGTSAERPCRRGFHVGTPECETGPNRNAYHLLTDIDPFGSKLNRRLQISKGGRRFRSALRPRRGGHMKSSRETGISQVLGGYSRHLAAKSVLFWRTFGAPFGAPFAHFGALRSTLCRTFHVGRAPLPTWISRRHTRT